MTHKNSLLSSGHVQKDERGYLNKSWTGGHNSKRINEEAPGGVGQMELAQNLETNFNTTSASKLNWVNTVTNEQTLT